MSMVQKFKLSIDKKLYNFVNDEVLPDLEIKKNDLWKGFSDLIDRFNIVNKDLLTKRNFLQKQINEWHKINAGLIHNEKNYINFLRKIGYLIDEGPDFQIKTQNVDPEISLISGPQLVVPITNARYAINAANARWGSLYDSIYGTNILGTFPTNSKYCFERGSKVINYAKSHLDLFAPLSNLKWKDVEKIILNKGQINFLNNNKIYNLINIKQIVGYKIDDNKNISELVLIKNNLHCRILVNSSDHIGKDDIANISDIILESAISTIMDCEDSVSTVDSDDKILAYRNWLGLMKGNIISDFKKK